MQVTKYYRTELTSNVVAENPRSDNAPIRAEQILEILLGHVLRQPTDIQVGTLYCFAARPGVRDLKQNRKKLKFFTHNTTK